MRRVSRDTLSAKMQAYLDRRQANLDQLGAGASTAASGHWDAARRTNAIGGSEGGSVLSVLRRMSGPRERCMYCMDSFGCDIEHFRPKAAFPRLTFQWANLLLCCTHCGRLKGDRFPAADGCVLLVDPSAEDPWESLDFDPDTGNIVARYLADGTISPKGRMTVETFALNARESLAIGYRRTFKRLGDRVRQFLAASRPAGADHLVEQLECEDEHGIAPWCFGRSAEEVEPFNTLRTSRPDAWQACRARFA